LSHEPYLYSDDSELLGSVLAELPGGDTFLEIGVGGASNLLAIAGKFKLVVGTDLAISHELALRKEDVELVVADRATCFRSNSFDVVAFNPPYVPSEGIADTTVDGGQGGIEIPLRFLSSALEVIKKDGRILVLLSSLDSLEAFEEFCKLRELTIEKAKERKLFFETLYVFVVTQKSSGESVRGAPVS
jgi:release factor glutamine methyltransferase